MCMYCERNGRDWEQMPPLPYMNQNRKDGQSAVTGNMISPHATTVSVRDYRSKQPEMVVMDRSFFLKYHNDPTGIGTVYIPIKFCPECGRRLGRSGQDKVEDLPDDIREALRMVRENGCNDSDIEDFITDRNLSSHVARAVWTQIAVWNAPNCCKGCEYVQEYPGCHCSRPLSDKFVPREGENIVGRDET